MRRRQNLKRENSIRDGSSQRSEGEVFVWGFAWVFLRISPRKPRLQF